MDQTNSSTAPEPPPRRFSALSHRNFRLLWLGQFISLLGSQMQNTAVFWHLDDLTHNPAIVALVGLVRFVPIILFSLIGGVIADVHDRRRILFITQSIMLTSAVILGWLQLTGDITPAAILILTGVTAGAGAFDNPARQALLPSLVPPELLAEAVRLNTIMFQTAMIGGPMLGGFTIAQFGVEGVYWTNAASFVAVIAALIMMQLARQERRSATKVNLETLLEGLRFVWKTKMIFSTMVLDFFATFLASANALLPLYARAILKAGPFEFGLLTSAEAVGSLLAGIGISIFGEPRRKGLLLLGSVAAFGLATAFFGLSESLILSLLLLFLVGVADGISTVLRVTIRTSETPDHMRGRMTSVNMIFFMGGPQLGNLEAGLLAAAVGAPASIVIGGAATMLVAAWTAWRFPQLREYTGHREAHESSPS